jgi:hypothetical protein
VIGVDLGSFKRFPTHNVVSLVCGPFSTTDLAGRLPHKTVHLFKLAFGFIDQIENCGVHVFLPLGRVIPSGYSSNGPGSSLNVSITEGVGAKSS